MAESPYEIGTDETAAKLGLSPRSVRRLGEKGILEGKVEITSAGKQWFFGKESVESLIRAREEKLKKEQRHQVAKDTLGHDRGQPRTSEDIAEGGRSSPMSDEKRVDFLEKLIEKEREEHAQTKEKLEQKETLLLEKAETAARLEGEKMAFEEYARRLDNQQQQLMGVLRDVTLKIASPETQDNFGHTTSDNRRQVRTTEVVSEDKTAPDQRPQSDKREVNHKASDDFSPPPESPQNEPDEDFSAEGYSAPTSGETAPSEERYAPNQSYGNPTNTT